MEATETRYHQLFFGSEEMAERAKEAIRDQFSFLDPNSIGWLRSSKGYAVSFLTNEDITQFSMLGIIQSLNPMDARFNLMENGF